MFKKLLPLLFLFAGFQINATIIEQSDGNLDWQYDNISGLQWLDLSLTDDYSIQSALDTYTGWRFANKAEFQFMFGQYEVSGDNLVVDQSCNLVSDDGALAVCEQFGANVFTDSLFSRQFGLTENSGGPLVDRDYSLGFYADGGAYRLGGIQAVDYRYSTEVAKDTIRAFYNYSINYDHGPLFHLADVGQFLVRSAVVSEPSIIALFALGIVGIGFARRRRS